MKDTSKTGFVYILTNPSFKEDWVKIGKSGRPVDVRSKELDNTAVPLPFDIYATIQTSKYSEVEKLVHKTIDRLTDKRIRQNREFFNIQPDVALDIFRDIASTLDDAVINTYNHGDVIHIAKNDADKKAATTSGVRKQKDVFWKGYIEEMRKSSVFNENFSIHDSLPKYSYDLRLGTTVCNIMQIAIVKKLTCGLYLRGKDLFQSLTGFRKEIDRILGVESEWTEYEKDCTIVVTKAFDLYDESSYPGAYAWLLDMSVRFKSAFSKAVELMNAPGANKRISVDEGEEEDAFTGSGRRARFRFSMIGIRPGEEVVFIPTGTKVKVATDDQVEHEGRLYKLSTFTGTFMPEDLRNESGAYQGAKFFAYKGRILNDMRDEIENAKETDL